MDRRINMLKTVPVASRILITGGFGFIGSQLLRLLRGYDVTVLDNLMSGMPLTTAPFILGDVRDVKLMTEIVPRYDIIIHMAAVVGEPACIINTSVSQEINASGTYNITGNLTPAQKFIFMSSSSVYGEQSENHVMHEGMTPYPNNNYAFHKTIGEWYTRHSDADFIILRPVTTFGVTDRIRMDLLVNNFVYQALTEGKVEVFESQLPRPAVHVYDVARVLKDAIDDKLAWNEIYNVGNPELALTKYQLATKICDMTGADIIPIEGKALDTRDYKIDFEKLLERGFTYTENSLWHCVKQIEANIENIRRNPDKYQTTEIFKQFLLKEKKGNVYN
jgi:nucleoside-diphosphate-sugar epimerase